MLAFSISIKALDILDVFGLAGLEFSQKLKICMLDLMVPITHFGQKCKGHPPKCVSRTLANYISETKNCFLNGIALNE